MGKLEWSLGIHHAMSSKKNWCLMTASFAFSIVLALCFSVLVQFVGLLLPSMCPWSPDISLNGYGNAQVLSSSVKKEIRRMPGVSAVWAATGVLNTPVSCPQRGVKRGVVCSYDDFMMGCSEEMLVEGTLADASGKSNQVMTIYNRSNPLKVGDTVRLHGTELTVVGAFSQGMFPDDVTIICPEKLFDRVMGKQRYNLMGVLLDDSATEETVLTIAKQATDDIVVEDDRLSKQRNRATYLASRIVVYGFLGILGLISLFHIVNSISMSVSARTKQYGAMRAVGMDGSQLTKMIAAEAGTYAVSGLVAGFAVGLPLSRMLHVRLITRYFGVLWKVPMGMSVVIILFVAAAAVMAVYAPAKRICHMPITETINEL